MGWILSLIFIGLMNVSWAIFYLLDEHLCRLEPPSMPLLCTWRNGKNLVVSNAINIGRRLRGLAKHIHVVLEASNHQRRQPRLEHQQYSSLMIMSLGWPLWCGMWAGIHLVWTSFAWRCIQVTYGRWVKRWTRSGLHKLGSWLGLVFKILDSTVLKWW